MDDDVPAFKQIGAIDGSEFEGWDSRHISIPSSLSGFEEEMSELYEAAFHPSNTSTPRPHPLAQPWLLLPPELEQRRQQQLAVLQAQHQLQVRHHQQQEQQQQQLQKQQQQRKTGGTRRKRKMDELRTVYRVPAEKVLTLDKWAWRKYGQKPIKGSPFPRNYYKCSSSKGCIARKQVERSITEPEVYVVTYTGDHFHPWPLHRNALAGITRSSTHLHKKTEAAPPPSNNSEEEEEEDGLLLIPNHKYMDEDMLRAMAELGQWNTAATTTTTSSTSSPHTSTPTGFLLQEHQQQM